MATGLTITDFIREVYPNKVSLLRRRGRGVIRLDDLTARELEEYNNWKQQKVAEKNRPVLSNDILKGGLFNIPKITFDNPLQIEDDGYKPPKLVKPNKNTKVNDKIVEVKGIQPSNQFEKFKNTNLTSTSQLITGPGRFQFIIDFGNGNFYTTKSFKIKLENAERNDNPYFNVKTATIVKLDGSLLSNYPFRNKFRIGEQYAEVVVEKTITTASDMMNHIDWLVTAGKEFRSTEIGKTKTEVNARGEVNISGIGSWQINHDPNGNLGFGWEELFKRTQEDKEFAELQYDTNSTPNDVVIVRADDVGTSSNITAIIQPQEPTFPPFDTPGEPGESRAHDGYLYFWSPTQQKWRREDSLTLADKETALQFGDPEAWEIYQYDVNNGSFSDPDRGGDDYDDRERYVDQALGLLQ